MNQPPEIQLNILSELDRRSLINMCQTNKYWNNICKYDTLWNNLICKDFGWCHGGNYQKYIMFHSVISELIATSIIPPRYLNYENMKEDLIPELVKTLETVMKKIKKPIYIDEFMEILWENKTEIIDRILNRLSDESRTRIADEDGFEAEVTLRDFVINFLEIIVMDYDE